MYSTGKRPRQSPSGPQTETWHTITPRTTPEESTTAQPHATPTDMQSTLNGIVVVVVVTIVIGTVVELTAVESVPSELVGATVVVEVFVVVVVVEEDEVVVVVVEEDEVVVEAFGLTPSNA